MNWWPSLRISRIALVCYFIILMVATHWPGAQVNVVPGVRLDLFIHFGAYAVLAGLMAFAGVGARLQPGRAVVLIVAITAVIAVLDEATQAIPIVRRTFGLDDIVADIAGGIVGAAIGVALARRRDKAVQQSGR